MAVTAASGGQWQYFLVPLPSPLRFFAKRNPAIIHDVFGVHSDKCRRFYCNAGVDWLHTTGNLDADMGSEDMGSDDMGWQSSGLNHSSAMMHKST